MKRTQFFALIMGMALLAHSDNVLSQTATFGLGEPITDEIRGGTALHFAAQQGLLGDVEKLITAGADVNVRDKNGATPLYVAAEEGHLKVLQKLIAAGADVDAAKPGYFYDTPLKIALRNEHQKCVEQLINADADINKGQFHLAAQVGDSGILQKLIDAGSVNAQDMNGDTPLHYAAMYRQMGSLQQLINAGADVNARNRRGRTPLDEFYAAVNYSGSRPIDKEIEDFLVKNGAVRTPTIVDNCINFVTKIFRDFGF